MKIAIVAPKAYPAFNRSAVDTFGGAEIAMSGIACNLARIDGIDVDVLVGDYGQPDVERLEGVALHRCLVSRAGPLRNVLRLLSTMKSVDADIYMQRTLSLGSTLIAVFCSLSRRRFIYWVAHDSESDGGHPLYHNLLTSPLVKLMYKTASHVIVQNEYEHDQLVRRFPGISCSVIKKGMVLPLDSPLVAATYDAVWVGRCDEWKNPEAFIRLAKECRSFRFLMVCPPALGKEDYHREVIASASGCDNLDIRGRTANNDVLDLVAASSVFCFTSKQEGDWPTVVLEAASLKKPILSLDLNYAGLIDEFAGGRFCEGDQSRFADELRTIIENDVLREKMGNGAYDYVRRSHNAQTQTAKLVRVINELS